MDVEIFWTVGHAVRFLGSFYMAEIIFRDRVVLFNRMHDSLGVAFGEVVIMNLTLTFYENECDPATSCRCFSENLPRCGRDSLNVRDSR